VEAATGKPTASSTYPTYTLGVPSRSYYPTLAVMAIWVPDEDNISNALFRVFDDFNNTYLSLSAGSRPRTA
jgi:hypothetical protein